MIRYQYINPLNHSNTELLQIPEHANQRIACHLGPELNPETIASSQEHYYSFFEFPCGCIVEEYLDDTTGQIMSTLHDQCSKCKEHFSIT
jgi:hypothetical protein